MILQKEQLQWMAVTWSVHSDRNFLNHRFLKCKLIGTWMVGTYRKLSSIIYSLAIYCMSCVDENIWRVSRFFWYWKWSTLTLTANCKNKFTTEWLHWWLWDDYFCLHKGIWQLPSPSYNHNTLATLRTLLLQVASLNDIHNSAKLHNSLWTLTTSVKVLINSLKHTYLKGFDFPFQFCW